MQLFHLDRERAAAELRNPTGAIAVVNPYSDADELNGLADDAQVAGIVSAKQCGAHFAIYPMSLSEPDPIVAAGLGAGPQLLGHPMKPREEDGETPIDFTLRLLAEMVAEASRLVAVHRSDSARLDRIAAFMNRHRPWNGGDVCEIVAMELRESGRALA